MKKMTNKMFVSAIVAVTAISTTSLAGTALQITFDEFEAANDNASFLTNEYAGMGVNFLTTDDGVIYDGLTGGDPGGWDIEGTNGTQFMGFNGSSYSATMLFDTTINAFRLDAARSSGSSAGNTVKIEGYLNGVLINFMTVTLGDINEWSTLSIDGSFDKIVMFGNGNGFRPFGVDNIQWNAVPTPSSLALLGLGGLLAGRRRR